MDDNTELIKNSIESSEGVLHKRCGQLRQLIFMNDDYDPIELIQIANDIKLEADIMISQCNKLKLF